VSVSIAYWRLASRLLWSLSYITPNYIKPARRPAGHFSVLDDILDAAPPTNMNSLLEFFQQMDPTMQSLFSEIRRLMILTATAPVTVASTERSFSALRRLKTLTRSTITELRLT
jgi:hypothetical protein